MIEKTYARAQIVVVDHEPETTAALSETLRSAGYSPPREIVNPRQAQLYLQAADPDLLILEVDLPGVDPQSA